MFYVTDSVSVLFFRLCYLGAPGEFSHAVFALAVFARADKITAAKLKAETPNILACCTVYKTDFATFIDKILNALCVLLSCSIHHSLLAPPL